MHTRIATFADVPRRSSGPGRMIPATPPSPNRLLQLALFVFGTASLLFYPLALIWPSGWAWHDGALYQSQYFMMLVGIYATLGLCLLKAARSPADNLSLSGSRHGPASSTLASLVRSAGPKQRPARRLGWAAN